MRAIVAGGGTGGHVIPALAIAQELQKRYSAEVLFIGTARGIENRLVPAAGFPLRLVQVGALNQVSLKTRLQTLFDLPRAVWDARGMLAEFRPDVVIGVGGYASGPAMLAAVLKGSPTANDKPTLLVFGGSQGANAINQAMIQCLPELVKQVPNVHIIHQTGERGYNDAQAAYRQAGSSAEVYPFITDMPAFFARADLILCRSGASTVAEITAAGKPAVFVPFPRAADDHQRVNAQALVRAGAAVVVEETKLERVWLADTIAALLGDAGRLRRMSQAARKLAHPDAARDIAAMAARLAGVEDESS